jgi:predicted hotdog family 3-hydroxylacyl-ACP dehydratase
LAAQAMAVHGALIAEASAVKPAGGFLASVRGVRLYVSRLDHVQSDLICDAVRIAGDRGTALYEFALRAAATPLMSGRATVVLDSSHRPNL